MILMNVEKKIIIIFLLKEYEYKVKTTGWPE